MRIIPYKRIVESVKRLCLDAAFDLPKDAVRALSAAKKKEKSASGRALLAAMGDNARIARRDCVPICQDTGIAVFFVDMGCNVRIRGGTLTDGINEGTRLGYARGYLRPSMVSDPLFQRRNTRTNTPAVIHCSPTKGNKLSITLAPKGGGSENMSRLVMLKPADGEAGVVDAAVETVTKAGGNPCPPVIVGIGIGGTAETAMLLSKKALLRPLGRGNPDKRFAVLERKIFDKVNSTGVGPGGLGGTVTALGVHIETFPCHIATLPVAVSLLCHAARHASVTL
ncbi:MAG TPA: fumarate hydratase [Chitinivibrionales bacterium]|jgi:fumarate hydratase subunit alpha|nr:fumarate hydratase [Chitinivibrionales bacterium]